MRNTALGLLVVAVVLGGGYWYLAHRTQPIFTSAQDAVASTAFHGAVERSDSIRIGQMALQQCGNGEEECYNAFLLTLAEQDRIALAMGALEVIAAGDNRVLRHAHDYAHMIGMRGFDPQRPVGETFSTCRVNFQSGCYHGVIQAYLTSLDTVGSAEVAALCYGVPAVQSSTWIRFQCVHGLGHGLVMRYNHDLPRGLAGCDLLADGWDRESCYGGAFMENVIATDEHHMPVRQEVAAAEKTSSGEDHEHRDHGDGGPAAEAAGPKFERVNPLDPHYPCSILQEQYKRACYGMQTSIMLELNHYNFALTAKQCNTAPVAHRMTCYQSLGTNISGNTVRNTRKSIETCLLGTARYQPWCFLGVVKNFIDVTSRPEDGLDFCLEVPAGPNQLMCYRAVGEQLSVLFQDPAQRAPYCDQVALGERRESCRYGAALTSTAPEGMPRLEWLNSEP